MLRPGQIITLCALALLTLGIPPSAIVGAVSSANEIVDGGAIQDEDGRTLIQRPEGSDSVSEIAALSVGVGGQVINLADVTNIYRTREANPDLVIRHNGQEAFTLGVAGIATENIVDIGKRVDDKLAQLRETLPLGISIESIYRLLAVKNPPLLAYIQKTVGDEA